MKHVIAKLDPENNRIVIMVVDETGATVSSEGVVYIALGDLDGGWAQFREFKVCDPATGAISTARMLATAPTTST